MTDTISEAKRSWNMSRIKGKDTNPELVVRSTLHKMGYRFRLHRKDLPGKPDIVLPKYKTVIFVHGCFWHQHKGCKFSYKPKTRKKFWEEKLNRNVERDGEAIAKLATLGWTVLVVWECETKDLETLERMLRGFLD